MNEVRQAVESGVCGWDDLRPEVKAMALLMERELRKNDHKGGWKQDAVEGLMDHLNQELLELAYVADPRWVQFAPVESSWGLEGVGSEAADVCNMALMVADVSGALDVTALV